jgi:hypothetical protein
MELKDAVIALVALALPMWLLVEQVLWWRDSAGSPFEQPAKMGTVETRERPMISPLPRKVA